MTAPQLIQIGIQRGLVHLPQPVLKLTAQKNLACVSRLRAKRRAAGLNWQGKPRVNRQWPELKGLNRKEYLREYAKLWRRR